MFLAIEIEIILYEWTYKIFCHVSYNVTYPYKTLNELCLAVIYRYNNNIYLLQLGCYPVAVVILHVNKHEIGYY